MAQSSIAQAKPVPRQGIHPRLILTIIVSCQMMFVVDTTAMTVALPKIQENLHFSTVGLSWVVNAYLLAFGGMLLLGGRAGDIFGYRRTFITGIALFTACSALGGLAPTQWWLLSARALQGAGAALAAPAAMSLIVISFREGTPRNRALALYSTVAGLGMAIGMLMSGVLTTLVSWRLVLGINVPIGLAALLLAPRFIEPTPRHPGRLGLAHALTVTAGVTALVWGLNRAATDGWGNALTIGSLAVAIVLLALYVTMQRRSAHPTMPLRLFRDPGRAGGYLAMMLTLACNFSAFFFIPLFLQEVLHYSPLKAGIAFLPLGAVMFTVSRFVPKLLMRFGARPLILTGLVLAAGGIALLTRITAATQYTPLILASTVLIGAGIGTFLMPLTGAILKGVPRENTGVASGIMQTAQQAGGALGLAIELTVYGTTLRHAGPVGSGLPSAITHGMANAFAVGVILLVCAIAVILLMRTGRPSAPVIPSPSKER
jgi:EmrB/QacA subfamily drug resistance transporter